MRFVQTIESMDFATGGPPRVVLALHRALLALNVESRVATVAANQRSTIRSSDGIWTFRGYGPKRLAYSPSYRRWISEEITPDDVVVAHSPYVMTTVLAARAARRAGGVFIFRPHGAFDPADYDRHSLRNRFLDRVYFGSVVANANACLWSTASEEARSRSRFSAPSNIHIPHGVDIDDLNRDADPRAFRRDIGLRTKDRYVLSMGRLAPKKRIDVAIRAFQRLSQELDDVHLVVAGSDFGVESELRALARTGPGGDRVHFVGQLDGQERRNCLAGASAFVLPSVGENFGIAALEAAALGIPTFISPDVGVAEYLGESEHVYIVSRDADALARSLKVSLGDHVDVFPDLALADAHSWVAVVRRLIKSVEALRREGS